MDDLTKDVLAGAKTKNLKKFLMEVSEENKKDKKKKKKKGEEEKEQKVSKNIQFKLPAPLSTPAAERVARSAQYARAKQDVALWDAVVHSGRAAETKKFPLVKADLRLATAKEYSGKFQVMLFLSLTY